MLTEAGTYRCDRCGEALEETTLTALLRSRDEEEQGPGYGDATCLACAFGGGRPRRSSPPAPTRATATGAKARKRARADLAWWYGAAEAALGHHGAGLEGGGGVSVWDEARSARAHAARHRFGHRETVDRYARVGDLVRQLSAHHQRVARAAFAPRESDVILRLAFADAAGYDSLVDVVLMTESASEAYRKAHGGKEPTRTLLAAWLRKQVELANARKPGVSVRAFHAEAKRMVDAVVDAFARLVTEPARTEAA